MGRQFAGSGVEAGSPQDASGAVDWVQTTISIPRSVVWSQPGQQVSAWVMADEPGVLSGWDQVGWLWQESGSSDGVPVLYVESGPSTFWLGGSLAPGGSVTVALSCDFGTDTYHNWLLGASGWQLVNTQKTGIPCDTGLRWDRYVEGATPSGTAQPVVSEPVSFTGTVADVLGAETVWPDLTGLVL